MTAEHTFLYVEAVPRAAWDLKPGDVIRRLESAALTRASEDRLDLLDPPYVQVRTDAGLPDDLALGVVTAAAVRRRGECHLAAPVDAAQPRRNTA